jgi:Flp pilus assembly pilin Flp
MLASLQRFRADERGFTLVESTFIMIILLLVMVNGSELQRYSIFARHLGQAAEGLAAVMGQRADALRDANWSDDARALYWLFPEAPALGGMQWRSLLGVQTSVVRFEPTDPECVGDCTYARARVVWTWDGGTAGSRALLQSNGLLRACGVVTPGSETPAPQSLPARLFKGGTLLAVTLAYDYKPAYPASVVGQRSLVREAYFVPPFGDLPINPFGLANEVSPCP